MERMDENKKTDRKSTQEGKTLLLSYLHDLTGLLAGVLLIFSLCFRVVVVSGPSMNKTLYDGDWLLVLSSTFYTKPQYGDIVVISKDSFDDGAPIIKRVIATEGQTVWIDFNEGIVYVDNIPLNEDYTNTLTTLDEGVTFPLVVDDGCVFVMGDNRNSSKDSRSQEIGLVDCREILGKAFFLFMPGTDSGRISRDFTRIGGVS